MEQAQHILTMETIQKRVADHFQIRHSDMTSKRRPNNIAIPRQIAMFLARTLTKHSLQEIGDAFGQFLRFFALGRRVLRGRRQRNEQRQRRERRGGEPPDDRRRWQR